MGAVVSHIFVAVCGVFLGMVLTALLVAGRDDRP